MSMWKKGSRYWLLLLIPAVVSLAWLYFTSGPKMTVEKNTTGQTMQQRLEADGVHVSYADEPRLDEPFKKVFEWTIMLDGVNLNPHKYRADRPSDGIWIVGGKPEDERCYIFTNRAPPSSVKELMQYFYR